MQRDVSVGCEFASWIDPETCARSKRFILGLLKKINAYEEEIEELKRRNVAIENELEHLKKMLMKRIIIWNCL